MCIKTCLKHNHVLHPRLHLWVTLLLCVLWVWRGWSCPGVMVEIEREQQNLQIVVLSGVSCSA